MPGNGVGDRVHNFFAQDNLPQGGPRGDGNWPLNDNLWVGNQKQFGVSDSTPRNFNPQQSESERGHGSQRVDPHLFNLAQTRPDFSKNVAQNSNGFMYGRPSFQTPPNEANFLGVETTDYGRNQRGFPFYDSQVQEPVPEEQQPPKIPFRSETTSEAHSGFDLFGGQSQHQLTNNNNSNQYPGFMQPLQNQQQQQQQNPGFGDIQQLQQQLMLRKMQELQRQELQRQQQQQQNSLNQASLFARQASGSHINGTPSSDWSEVAVGNANTNWLQRGSPQVQGSSSGGLAFSPEQSQSQSQPNRSMGFAHQQVDQSLYGVPVSNSRSFPQNQFPGGHFVVPDQQVKSLFGNNNSTPGQQPHIQQIKTQQPPQQNVAQDLFGSVVVDDNNNKSASEGEAALDPDEEKILFGSDDTNIWEAFGSSKTTTGGVSSLLDDNEFAGGLPSSLQSGSWSALMQSAVAETITSGAGAQEEWPDLNFQNHPPPPPPQPQPQPQVPLVKPDERFNINMSQSKQMNQNWLNRGNENFQKQNQNQNQWNANESSSASMAVPPSAKNTGFNMNNGMGMGMGMGMGQGGVEGISGINSRVGVNRGLIPNQLSQNNNQVNYWKHVDSSKSRGSDTSDRSQGRVNNNNNKGPQVSESSFNSSDKEDLRMHERENSNDSYRSSSSHLPNTTLGQSQSQSQSQREVFSSDAGDSRSLQQSLSNQGSRKPAGPPKFQYHPMGNLDDDVGMPYGRTQGVNTKGVIPQGHFGHNKIGAQKEVEGVMKAQHDMRFKGMIPGHVPDLFASHDRSVGLSTSDNNKPSQPSQNMLELLHKVDQSRRQMNNTNSSLERNPSSEIPEPENSDGSFGGHQRTQSSNSQGIGLQLGPPSQRLPLPNHPSPRPIHHQQQQQQPIKPNPLAQAQAQASSRGKSHANLSPFPSFQETSVSGQSGSETSGGNKMVVMGSDFSNSRNQFQNQQMVRGQVQGPILPTNHSVNNEETRVRTLNSSLYDNSSEKFPAASQPRGNSGVPHSQQGPGGFPKMWANIPTQQLFSARKPQAQSNLATSHHHPMNIVESTSSGQQESTNEKVDRGQSQMPDGPGVGVNDNNIASQKDLEAFGRSLKPNNNQFSLIKNTENDPNNNKRLKKQDNLLPGQSQSQGHTPQSSETPVSKEVVASDQNGPHGNIPGTSVKIEHSHISPQMAPTWFDQYGTLKNSQQLTPQRADAVKSIEPPFGGRVVVGAVSGSLEAHDKEHVSAAPDPTPKPVVVEQLSSALPLPLPLPTNIQNSVTLRPKKRKYSPPELHPWVKEVSGDSKNIQDVWSASTGWCAATNRLMEKVDDDGEIIEDISRPKRRIILSTQLMQQIFPPPPSTILSDSSNHESVAFYAARMALGTACNLVSSSHSHSGPNPISEEAVEDCMSKSKSLENDFSRLDKRASILDLRVECQEVEKFSIINRFARYHGRGGQSEAEETTTTTAVNAQKPPQRYVMAVPLPKNLPERVQCLSL